MFLGRNLLLRSNRALKDSAFLAVLCVKGEELPSMFFVSAKSPSFMYTILMDCSLLCRIAIIGISFEIALFIASGMKNGSRMRDSFVAQKGSGNVDASLAMSA